MIGKRQMMGKTEINIIEYFKSAQLETDVGEFSYVEMLGQGGNTKVLSFKKGEDNFAVKFIPHTDKGKLNRFKDEYFCAIQINTHENIAHLYHFDSIKIEEENFSIIIMKQYASSLKKLGTISKATDDEKALLGWKLMNALVTGLNHLHQNAIIHRDIKPENIFFDSDKDTFVIGDLGIANFSKDFPKEALTVVGERLSNYLYSPPDQVSPKDKPNPTWDIYALGQVLSWYLYDLTIRGDGRETYSGANADLKILDKIIHRCVQNDPLRRFSTIIELKEAEKSLRYPKRDIFERLYDLDHAFKSSIPKIEEFYETDSQVEINRFLENFSKNCDLEEFWWIDSDGGDSTLEAIARLDNGRWLLHHYREVRISKIICYKHTGMWKSFFILLTEKDDLFEFVDFDEKPVQHPDATEWPTDYAILFNDKYMLPSEFRNGHYEHNGVVLPVLNGQTSERQRMLQKDVFMIVPRGTGPDRVPWHENKAFLKSILEQESLTLKELHQFHNLSTKYTSDEILYKL